MRFVSYVCHHFKVKIIHISKVKNSIFKYLRAIFLFEMSSREQTTPRNKTILKQIMCLWKSMCKLKKYVDYFKR